MNEAQVLSSPYAGSKGRVMLCNVGRLGDTILRNSILDSAFRTYSKVDYICGRGNEELLRSDSRLNQITVLHNSMSGFLGVLKAAWGHHYDGFIELKDHQSWTSLIIAILFRSKVKTGWNRDNLRPFHRDVRSVYAPRTHKTEIMRRIGQLAGLKMGEYKPSLKLAPDSVQWFRQNHEWQKPFIFLNISATAANRVWPVAQWARYVHGCGLSEESILVNGLPKHREMVNELCAKLPKGLAFQPRKFMDVSAALADSRLVLSVDTGVVHASSALNKPIVAFYSSGSVSTENEPTSTRRLLIQSHGSISEMDPEKAIAETLRRGLP
jgi:ADP-heptose:LPS heptosyltransferase